MKRRTLLQSMIALPVAGALSGCKHHDGSKGILRVILQGPFGVVTVRRGDDYRINAFVPLDKNFDPNMQHQFRFGTPTSPAVGSEGEGKRFHLELGEKGLELGGWPPYRDHGFDDFNLRSIGDWRPEPDKYFIYLDLPAPDVITYIPPTLEVEFTKRPLTGSMPVQQILEYRVSDMDDVHLHSDTKELDDKRPVSISNLLQEYRKHWETPEHKQHEDEEQQYQERMSPHSGAPYSQRTFIEENLQQSLKSNISTFFFAVGLSEKYPVPQLDSHGVRFFNESLLPAFINRYNSGYDDLERRLEFFKLKNILGYGRGCQAGQVVDTVPGPSPSPSPSTSPVPSPYRPALYGDWVPLPHLRTVGSSDECTPGGVGAIAGGGTPTPTPT